MKLRWMTVIPALMGAAIAVAPQASAAPSPGDRCGVNDYTSPDGTLTCSHQAFMWMHKGMPMVHPGDSCTILGDATYTPPEDIVRCRPSGSGLTWQR